MPTPERLTKVLKVDGANITLAPPKAGDRPLIDPTSIWKNREPHTADYEHYRMLLARYSSTFPARQTAHGYVPENVNVLAWVIYVTPLSPSINGCGGWTVDATNARTGQGLGVTGYGP